MAYCNHSVTESVILQSTIWIIHVLSAFATGLGVTATRFLCSVIQDLTKSLLVDQMAWGLSVVGDPICLHLLISAFTFCLVVLGKSYVVSLLCGKDSELFHARQLSLTLTWNFFVSGNICWEKGGTGR